MKKLLQAGLLLISFGFYNNIFGQGIFHIKSPAGVSGMYNFSKTFNNYGGNIDSLTISGKLFLYPDSSGCTQLSGIDANIQGNIVLINRGACSFGAKILNAQKSGATAVIIINNVPNDGVSVMGEDTSKTRFLNIPAIMISYEDGAKIKALVNSIDYYSNLIEAYIGKINGYFDNDLQITEASSNRARNFATPKELINETNNSIKLGTWVTNNGKTMQNAVTLKAEMFLGEKLIHSVVNKLDTLDINQNKWIGLAPLVSSIYPNGYYTIKYSVNSDKADDFTNNNQVISNFYINDSIYSKSRLDSTGRPIGIASTGGQINKWCVVLDEPKAGNIKVNGLTFATVSQADSIHTGASVTASFYEWSDNLSDSITFNNLNLLQSTSYTYKINESNVFLTSKFNVPIILENGKRYMGCLEKNNANLWILADNKIDYKITMGSYRNYYEPFFPVYVGGTTNIWYSSGFGTNIVPAILINTSSNLAPLDTTNSSAWNRKADFIGEEKNGSVGFSIGNKGYIGTGHDTSSYKNSFWEYDPLLDVWSQKANLPGPARISAVGMNIEDKGYLGLGLNGTDSSSIALNDFWQFSPDSNIWSQKASLPGLARSEAVSFSIGNKGYVGTGYDKAGNKDLNDFWEYDPANDTWTQKANFGGKARSSATGFSVKGKGYLGMGSDGWYMNDFWEYNPISDSWAQKNNVNFGGRIFSVGLSVGNKGYIATGGSADGLKKDFWEYDPLFDSWTEKESFSGNIRQRASGFSIGNSIYIGTGDNGDRISGNYIKNDFWEYKVKQKISLSYEPRFKVPGLCAGEKFDLPFYLSNNFDSIYEYAAQLSDTNWSFNNPITIGTLKKGKSDSSLIKAEIPAEIFGNRTYKYRVVRISDSKTLETSSAEEIRINKPIKQVIVSENNKYSLNCKGDEINLSVKEGYNFLWNDSTASQIKKINKGGKYKVTYSSNGCPDSLSIEIIERPVLKANVMAKNISCFGNKDGMAISNISGGTAPYSFNWSNGSKKDTMKNIVSGTYYLLVSDSVGCNDSLNFIIKQPSEITLTTSKNDATCGNTTGFASVNATGGVGGYNYLWSNQSTQVAIGNLMAGGYSVTVTDTNNCSETTVVNIGNTDGPSLDSIFQQATSCAKNCDGSASIVIKGGKEPYTYVWNNNSAKNTSTANGLCMGINSVKVKDADNCAIGAYIEVTALMPDPVFAGNVTINGEKLTSGNVQLYKYSKSQGAFRVLGYSDIDSDGKYSITGMQSGSYIIAVNPDTTKYPLATKTYYSGKEKWSMADTIMAYCDKIEEINLVVIELPQQTGLGKISGRIVDNTNGKRTSEPLPGVDVSLEEEPDNKIVSTTKTDANGNYQFVGVELGNYKIYVDIPGLGMTNTYNVEVQAEDTVVNDKDFYVDSTGTINVEVNAGLIKQKNNTIFELYPNPSKDKIYISSNYSKEIEIHVTDLLGNEVIILKNIKSGDYVDLKNLEAGIYYFKITAQGTEIIKKVIKQ